MKSEQYNTEHPVSPFKTHVLRNFLCFSIRLEISINETVHKCIPQIRALALNRIRELGISSRKVIKRRL